MPSDGWYDRLMMEARVRLPGAIDEALKVELFSVFDEFFKGSHIWQESILLSVVTTDRAYEIDSNEWVATVNEFFWAMNSDQIPFNATMETAGVLVFERYPPAPDVYTVRVSLTVADALDGDGYPQVPEWVLIRYRETLKDGLLGKMMSQPAKPYYNEKLGTYHSQRFRNGITNAYADMKGGNTFNGQRWRFPQSFSTSRRQ